MTATHAPAAFAWRQAQAGARAFSLVSDPVKLLGGGMAAADGLVVLFSSAGAYLLRNGGGFLPREIAGTTLVTAVLMMNAMWFAGCYTRHIAEPLLTQIKRASKWCSLVLVTLVIFAYLTKTSDGFSRIWAVCFYLSVLSGIAIVRFGAALQLARWRRQGRLARTVAVVDIAGTGERLARQLMQAGTGDMRLVGVFSPQPTNGRKNGIADLIALSRLFRIDEVFISTSGRQQGAVDALDTIDAVARKLGTIAATVRLCPEMPEMALVPREAGLLFGHPVLTIYHRPLMGWNRVVKRMEDLVICVIALVLAAPVMAIVAVLIKLDSPGPVLFRQKRPGFNNNVITVFKFRSMVHRPSPDADTYVQQAQRNDPRVTRIGRILRRTSIDELPQLFNVLGGKMSLVGPRPHAVAHNDQYAALIDDYLGRHRVQPGITGWAQVNGLRGETETLDKMQRRVEHDLYYIDQWSLSLDLKILFLTALRGAFDRNAY